MKKSSTIIIGLSFLLVSNAYADYRNNHRYQGDNNSIDHRQEQQYRRIDHGLRTGVLSRREAEKLRCEQEEIARLERRFLRDGWYSDREQRKLQRKLNKASNRIHKYKHNDRYSRSNYHKDHNYDGYKSRRYRSSAIHIGSRNGNFNIRW